MARTQSRSLPRTAALVALGALAVHQLRYLASYGGDSGHRLAEQGHGYLSDALPIVAGFALAALAACVLRGAVSGMRDEGAAAKALPYALAIMAVFASQEVLEGAFSRGHAAGLAAVSAHGGWLAAPLALLCGWVCSKLDRGVRRLERIAARAREERPLLGRPEATVGTPRLLLARPLVAAPLAFGVARRPPPVPAR